MSFTTKAEMTTAAINDLPDSAFAYIEPGGTRVGGRTEPRSLRHFPIHDAAHVRSALSRLSQSPLGPKARSKVLAAARRFDIEVEGAGKAHSMAADQAREGANVLSQLYGLLSVESDQPGQAALLDTAIGALSRWLEAERAEVGSAADMEASGYPMKAWQEPMKAEDLTPSDMDRWLAGERSRRILVVPFGGPLPGGKAGLDIDGEYFDEETDLYGHHAGLRRSRERLVDWHHDLLHGDPTGVMKGAILGRIVLDAGPEDDGVWADFWANAGERRRELLAALEARGVPLYGSSQAFGPDVRRAQSGHIEVWPIIRHTITTSPQNTFAVVPPLKAVLATAASLDALSIPAVHAAMFGVDVDDPLRTLSEGPGNAPGKAGDVLSDQDRAALSRALDDLEGVLHGRVAH